MEKKSKHEYRYKQKAITDIGRNRVSGVHVARTGDFYLFCHLKKHLKGTRYSSHAKIQTAASRFFCFQFREFYETGARKLISRWLRYVLLDGDYAEVYQIKDNEILFLTNIFWALYLAHRARCKRGGVT